MAKCVLNIGKTPVTLDTEKPAESQEQIQAAVDQVADEKKKDLKVDLEAARSKSDDLSGYLADETIRMLKASDDPHFQDRVDSEEAIKAEREYLVGLPAERLQAEHKRVAKSFQAAQAQTKNLDPDDPTEKELSAEGNDDPSEFAPKQTATVR